MLESHKFHMCIMFKQFILYFQDWMSIVTTTEGDKIIGPSYNNQERPQTETQLTLFRKFQKFISSQRMEKLRNLIKIFHGRNFPIQYRDEYNFSEQWQNTDLNDSGQNSLLEESSLAYFIFSIVLMAINITVIWIISFQRYFDTKTISSQTHFLEIDLCFYLIDVAWTVYYRYQKGESITIKNALNGNIQNVLCIGYFTIVSFWEINGAVMCFVELIIIGLLYIRSSDVYKYLKLMDIGLNYENQIKIFNLCCNIFIEAHIFAIVLFTSSKFNENKNWVDQLGISLETPFTKYIYSFYFASTTMLTIGYGDITPICTEEIIVTVLIEIIGVVSFGYLLNEMGHTLSKMREESQALERDLQTLSKISKYYNLERKLQNRAKSFLFSNQVRNEELKVEDQDRVLMKLNEELRQQINHENSLTVVKSCIFFLCHWSKNLQSEVARRLEKRLFAPNEKIVAPNSVARVYIVKRGRIDISMNRYGSNQDYRRLLKVIDTATQGEVADNIYGYTTVFSNRAVRLQAVAKDFTSTYSITREKFIDCVRQNISDFEYFHEIKCRIDQSSFCQEWEAPSIKNIREHFVPSRIIVIKKFRHLQQKSLNNRRLCFRHQRTKVKLLQNFVNKEIQSDYFPGYVNYTSKTIEFIDQRNMPQSDVQESLSQPDPILKTQSQSYEKQLILAAKTLKSRHLPQSFEQKDNKKLISHAFEKHQEYKSFFRFNNILNVLNNLERSNYLEKNIKFCLFEPNEKMNLQHAVKQFQF